MDDSSGTPGTPSAPPPSAPTPPPSPPREPEAPETYSALGQFEMLLETYLLRKAPFAIPDDVREFLVKVLPWVEAIFVLAAIPAIFALAGGSAVGAGGAATVAAVFGLARIALCAVAIPGLFKRTKRGWTFSFYVTLLSAVDSLVSVAVVYFLINTVIGLYILFQLKYLYRN